MGSIDLFLEDEGQQYGNMEEAASVARTPDTCLEVWSGDHRQTPGGLKNSQEAKAFRKKLTKRPLALRCQTRYVQAHDLEKIVLRYLDCPKESFAWKLRQLLIDGSSAIDPAVGQFWHEHFGDSPPCLSTEIQRAAYAILWIGLRGEREGLPCMLATTFAEAAGVSGRQKWGLVLSSSARVSQVTYQTVVGVRYPELVTYNGTQWQFGKYVQQESPLPGGFPPIFWDVPRANIHAVEDIGAHSCMALGMSGRAKPTFIFMMANSPVHRQMELSSTCSNRIAFLLVRISLPRQLWRHCKIMSRTITRFGACTSLLWTCGGLGSTILTVLKQSPISFGIFLIVMTHTE